MNLLQGIAVGSSVLNALTAIFGARNESVRYGAAQDADNYNAAVLRQRAETTSLVYGQQEERQRRQARQALGEGRAAAAQSGLGTGGSNADVMRQQEVEAELDALNIRYQGTLERQSLLDQSRLSTFSAGLNSYNAGQARAGGFIGVGASLLSGVGDYYKYATPKTKRPVRS